MDLRQIGYYLYMEEQEREENLNAKPYPLYDITREEKEEPEEKEEKKRGDRCFWF